MTFAGFPARPQSTAIPNVFLSDVLPRLADDAVSMGVVLYAFNLLARRKGYPRYLTTADFRAEPGVASFLLTAQAGDDAVERGLTRAVELGALLTLSVTVDGSDVALFFLNAPADRRGMEAIRSGAVALGPVVQPPPASMPRSSVFALYESLIGGISPLVADELAEAERRYPHEWLEAAFREAAAQNARSWRYVSRILERWAVEGPDYAKTGRDAPESDRYFSGKYGRILKQRLNP
ncbi:MAG: DnaD domain protein [Dehalococcoidia bacterium]